MTELELIKRQSEVADSRTCVNVRYATVANASSIHNAATERSSTGAYQSPAVSTDRQAHPMGRTFSVAWLPSDRVAKRERLR